MVCLIGYISKQRNKRYALLEIYSFDCNVNLTEKDVTASKAAAMNRTTQLLPLATVQTSTTSYMSMKKEKSTHLNVPLNPACAALFANLCNSVTRSPIQLESCSNHLRIHEVFKFRFKFFYLSLEFFVGDVIMGVGFRLLAEFTWP